MTAAAGDLVDAKDEAVKAGLRLDMAQAVSDVLIALEKQGRELASALERRNAIIDRRLTIAAYWLFGGTAAGHAATISVVIALAG